MKCCLYCWTWLSGSGWVERVAKYIDYYRQLKSELGFDQFVLAENGLSKWTWKLKGFEAPDDISVATLTPELKLGGMPEDYPYVWRGFYFIQELMSLSFDKIILIDSDSFILSQRMANFIRDTNHGFYSFWSEWVGYPVSEITVINKDAYPMLLDWLKAKSWQERASERKRYETELPYTDVYRQFRGDRYGFMGEACQRQTPDMDFYTQAKTETVLAFQPTPKPLD